MLLTRSILFAVLAAASACAAQTETTLIDEGFRQMYNLEFDAAHRTFQEWEHQHPDDPMGPTCDAAAYLYNEFDRLHILQSELFVNDDAFTHRATATPDPVVKRKFEEALNRSQQLSDKTLAGSPKDRNATFAAVLRTGLHSDYLAMIEKRYVAALAEVKASRLWAEKLLSIDPKFYDAYMAIGAENYLLSIKPAPVRWILRMTGSQTDKDEGVKKLRLAAENGRYLVPYARLLLAVAALRDNDRNQARSLLQGLVQEFPKNRLYSQELARLK